MAKLLTLIEQYKLWLEARTTTQDVRDRVDKDEMDAFKDRWEKGIKKKLPDGSVEFDNNNKDFRDATAKHHRMTNRQKEFSNASRKEIVNRAKEKLGIK
jgi:hypothetical protein